MAIFRVCAESGCPHGKLDGSSYCPHHHAHHMERLAQRRTRNNNSLYASTRWRAIRARRLTIEPDCRCGCGQPADTVDHVVPIEAGGDPYDLGNTASYTRGHHSRKTASADGGFGNARR